MGGIRVLVGVVVNIKKKKGQSEQKQAAQGQRKKVAVGRERKAFTVQRTEPARWATRDVQAARHDSCIPFIIKRRSFRHASKHRTRDSFFSFRLF